MKIILPKRSYIFKLFAYLSTTVVPYLVTRAAVPTRTVLFCKQININVQYMYT